MHLGVEDQSSLLKIHHNTSIKDTGVKEISRTLIWVDAILIVLILRQVGFPHSEKP